MPRAPLAPPDLNPAPLEPGLYLVSTPIGNLRDITLRALDVLAGCDVILAEDTRVTGKLLAAYSISKKLERCDDHAAPRVSPKIMAMLEAGAKIALVSDAGTPLVSDPGYVIVRDATAAGHRVWPIPGASAALAALSVSGLPADRFLFVGFPPAKAAARRTFFEELAPIPATLIFYEGGSRLAASLADMAAVFGPRPAAVCRELTKLYETITRGALSDLAVDPQFAEPRGELAIVVGPGHAEAATAEDADAALIAALAKVGPGEAAAQVSRALGLPRSPLYRRALALQGKR